MAYDDGVISCDDEALVIRRYYPWGTKRIPYTAIKGVREIPLVGMNTIRRARIWGTGDFVHWWNFDPKRTRKTVAFVIDVGRRVRPTITPDEPETVERILKQQISV